VTGHRGEPWPPNFVRDLRALIWAWDPADLVDLSPPEDEYDWLVTPVSGWLRARLPPEEMADRLRRQLPKLFGVKAPGDTLDFATAVIAWYRDEISEPTNTPP
jgi:hypothetical protein